AKTQHRLQQQIKRYSCRCTGIDCRAEFKKKALATYQKL
ncbi:hypothetical protein, partial [uncultured Gammaproteobacteria bacterium]